MSYRYRFASRGLVLGFALGLLVGAHSVVSANGVMNITMEDQFQNPCETSKFLGDVVILVYAERHGAEDSLDLGRKLQIGRAHV